MQIAELQIEERFDLQIEELSADRGAIFKLKSHLPIEKLSVDRRIILFADWIIFCRSNFDL